ncbi:hypothetical protein K9L97_06095 [Candidatus Woesearchaeota archaeon]|nr:hypothetical protein [Candidatus Woesearchaeota archaeon]
MEETPIQKLQKKKFCMIQINAANRQKDLLQISLEKNLLELYETYKTKLDLIFANTNNNKETTKYQIEIINAAKQNIETIENYKKDNKANNNTIYYPLSLMIAYYKTISSTSEVFTK